MTTYNTAELLTNIIEKIGPINSRTEIHKAALEFIKICNDQLKYDPNLIRELNDLAARDTSIQTMNIPEYKGSKIKSNSIIIYFKNAGLLHIYDNANANSALDLHLGAEYRKQDHVYEVIPNDSPQKIIIIVHASMLERIEAIKSYIIGFMISIELQIEPNDILIMHNGDTIEILINKYFVSSAKEKNNFIQDLMAFIEEKEENMVLTSNMNCRTKSDFINSQMVLIPTLKTFIGSSPAFRDGLIKNVDGCRPISSNGNTYIIAGNIIVGNISNTVNSHNNNSGNVNNNSGNVNNNTVNNVTNNILHINVGSDNHFNEFIQHIKDQKPSWYKSGKWVMKDSIFTKYVEMYGDVSKIKFYKNIKNKIYNQTKRARDSNKRIYQMKLFTYEEIPDIFDEDNNENSSIEDSE
jgi:hypothetical protein